MDPQVTDELLKFLRLTIEKHGNHIVLLLASFLSAYYILPVRNRTELKNIAAQLEEINAKSEESKKEMIAKLEESNSKSEEFKKEMIAKLEESNSKFDQKFARIEELLTQIKSEVPNRQENDQRFTSVEDSQLTLGQSVEFLKKQVVEIKFKVNSVGTSTDKIQDLE
jgi:septal ring factor EnvC (AmiA/AmiB activator)